MAEQNDKYFTTSNHPSLHYTQQTSPYIKKNNKKSSSIVNQRGSVRDSVVLQNDKNYSRRTHFKSDYSGLTRPVNDGSRLYHSYLWDENKQKQHVERVINIKPRVDHAAPDVNSFHLFSMQKMRDMNRRKQKLDDENRIIVDRVSKIMSDGRSDLDCWNPEPYKPDDSYYKREATKKRERENSFILERLVSIPPSADSHRMRLLDQHKEATKYKNHMRKIPLIKARKIRDEPSSKKQFSLPNL